MVPAANFDAEISALAHRITANSPFSHRANKRLMRAAAMDLVPAAIAGRPKQGFKPPIDHWLRGRLRSLAHDALLSSDARLAGQVDPRGVRQLLEGHDAGTPNGHRIWALLVHELWSRTNRVA